MTIFWIKAFHLFFIIAWFAGIFYLPRIFVYHADATDDAVKDTFKVMERRLWWFVLPFAVLTGVTGLGMLHMYGTDWMKSATWLHPKLTLVVLVYAYYTWLYTLMKRFQRDDNRYSARVYRILNEAPVLVLLGIVLLAVLKPAL